MPLCSVPGCDREATKKATGMCGKHAQRVYRLGTPYIPELDNLPPEGQQQWLVDHVTHDGDECLIWPWARTRLGRGLATIYEPDGTKYRVTPSVYILTLKDGPRPHPKMHCAHSCGKGHLGCVNPKHLRWATARENSIDAVIHGTNPRVHLTPEQALAIYNSPKTPTELGAEFGITPSAAGAIKRGRVWGHVTGQAEQTRKRREWGRKKKPALEHFRGYVEEVRDGTVYTVARDDSGTTERLTFPISRVPPRELPYVMDGAVFTMSVFKDRTRIRFSKRKWTEREIRGAQKEAERVNKLMQEAA